MGTRCSIFFLLIWGLLPLLPAQQKTVDVAAIVRELEHQWVEGQTRKDNRALDLFLDNGLVYVEDGRLITKGEYLARVKAPDATAPGIVIEDMAVRSFDDTATVIGIYRQTIVNSGKTSITRWRFVDSWVQKEGRWMLIAAAAAPWSR